MFNKIKGFVNQVVDEFQKFTNEEYLEATIASCVLVAAADGSIDKSETDNLKKAIAMCDTLKVYDTARVLDEINRCVAIMKMDTTLGKIKLMEKIKQVTSDPQQAKQVLATSIFVAKGDGVIKREEKEILREIGTSIGLDLVDFKDIA